MFEEVSEPDGAEVDVEEAMVNLLEADVVAGEELADGDTVSIPSDASVLGDNLTMLGC